MKPDAYIPLYGNDFIVAVKGHTVQVKWSYWLALWHYWSHEHCDGLRNDKRYLQAVCECPDAAWPDVESALFSPGGFFKLIAGRWHQMRAQEEWRKIQAYNRLLHERAMKGVQARVRSGSLRLRNPNST